MGIGPISYRDVMWYADDMGLSPFNREFLWDVMKKVDAKYLKLVNDKLEASRPRPKSSPKGLPNG